ncbi:hypothetical protein GCM10009718_20930 [Isoptericola halotolerans]
MALAVALVFVATDASADVGEPEAADRPWVESDTVSVGDVLEDAAEAVLDLMPDVGDEDPGSPEVDDAAEEWDEPIEPPQCVQEAASPPRGVLDRCELWP